MIDKTLSHFRVVRKIGEGGMGVVYEAEDVELQRRVALKVLRPDSLAREDSRLRFLREARVAASISHPHIGTIYEVGEAGGQTFIAMEYVEGRTLREVIGGRPMPVADALRTAAQVAEGLAAAHEARVIHRDLKPENVMMSPDGRARILDFGLAKPLAEPEKKDADATVALSEDGRIVGTVAYMAPEQARGLAVDARSDHFAFGAMLYEMVTGKSAFQGETASDTLARILRDQPPPSFQINPDVPPELERIIEKCLEKDPADRYQDTRDLAVDLRRLIRDSDSGTGSGSGSGLRPVATAPTARRNAGVVLAVTAAAVVLAAILGLVRPWERGGDGGGGTGLERSLAVMPFQNLKDAEDTERLGQILQELVIADLSGDTDLRVFSSQRLYDVQKQLGSTGRRYDRETATRIAERVGAQTMLEGTLSQLGDRWILTATIVDVETGTVSGSCRVDGTDLYAMVDEVSEHLHDEPALALAAAPRDDVRKKTSASLDAYRLYVAGTELLNEQAYEAAADTLALAVKADPDFGKAYYKLAMAQWWAHGSLETGSKEARGTLRPVLDRGLFATRQERLMAEAAYALIGQEWDQARELYEQVTELHREEKEAWYGLGESQFHGSGTDPEVTLASFERAVELDPSFTLGYMHIFDLNAQLGRNEDSLRRIDAFIAAHPDKDIGYRWKVEVTHAVGGEEAMRESLEQAMPHLQSKEEARRTLVYSARRTLDRGDVLHARDLVERAREIDPEGVDALWRATDLRVQGELGHYDALLARMDRTAEDYPGEWGKILKMKSDVLLLKSGPEAARAFLEELEETGRYEEQAGDLKLASRVVGDEAKFREVLDAELDRAESDAKRADILAGVGWNALEATADEEEAEVYLARALAVDPDNGWARSGLGWCRLRSGRIDEAESEFRKAVEASPGHPNPQIGLVAVQLARGLPAEAERMLREMLEKQETLHGVRWLSVALAEQGRWQEALSYGRRGVAMSPSTASLSQLAWVLIAGDLDLDEGEAVAEQARGEWRPYFQGRYQWLSFIPSPEHCLGLAAVKRGDLREGVAMLEEAAKLRPDRERIREDLERARALL